MLNDEQDAFGHGVYDYLNSSNERRRSRLVLERDDGLIETDDIGGYFSEYRAWPAHERRAMRYARGRILDIGSGAGRHSVYLQGKGMDVLAIDNSPLALQVCRMRGVKATLEKPVRQINASLGIFDTVLMLCGNFGLFENRNEARRLLKKLAGITSDKGRIIAESNNVYQTENPEHLAYHQMNRDRGRMSGQIRMRVRYHKYATPWFDYLQVSPDEMQAILEGTDWHIGNIIASNGSKYIAVIEKILV
jgi:SAM-dependent methyltransferase